MTHSAARKRGYASSLLTYTGALADSRNQVMYLDAEQTAIGLYQSHGFVCQDQIEQSSLLVPMLRPRKLELVASTPS